MQLPVARGDGENIVTTPEELGAARHILTAAAYTYVAGALIDLINLPRLLKGLR